MVLCCVSNNKTLAPGQTEPAQPDSKRKFTSWHASTAVLLALGYSGYYFCRSDLSVVLPDLIHDMARHGMSAKQRADSPGFNRLGGHRGVCIGQVRLRRAGRDLAPAAAIFWAEWPALSFSPSSLP